MKFIHISREDGIGSHGEQAAYFSAACAARDIEYVRLTERTTNPLTLDPVQPEDIVYRSAASVWGKSLERMLLQNPCRTIYHDQGTVITGKGSSYYHFLREGLPAVPSIAFLPVRKRDTAAYADAVGGFPLVIKVNGGMEGVGVLRVDSPESFNSVADFIRKDPHASYRIMQYIPHDYYGRLVVVGDQVVAATRDMPPLGDFRANARGPREARGKAHQFSAEIETLAVRAAHSVGVHFAGVDVIMGNDGNVYLAEANSPFNFAETQRVANVDIAGALIDELL